MPPNILVIWGDDIGQSVFRTGLSKVGMPGADVGLQAEDATIAELLKPRGYATGQLAAAGEPDIVEKLKAGHQGFKVHIDGYNLLPGTIRIWAEPFVALRVPKLYNLRLDPFERADITSNTYYDWLLNTDFILLAATSVVAQFLATFKDFPPRQKAASFTIDQVVAKLESVITSGR